MSKQNSSLKKIKHSGIVSRIEGATIIVSITNKSACASCHANGTCTSADKQDKEIEVHNYEGSVKVGNHVEVICNQEMGIKALFLGYLLPFLLVMLVLITATIITDREEIAGISALAVLVPYYIVLALLKQKIKKSFTFSINRVLE
ncbi:Fis family transcriptional regulator [Prolixibacteraceae bacterium JC049]|nr:Fis family transcriptional regulator [Prolixibacteraceae bacterium JC049]